MKKVFLYAFKHSIPILISFLPVGIAYGILMHSSGYGWGWTAAASLFVYAGSLQYLMVTFLTGGVSLVVVALMALLLNSRHIFYGIPFLEKWKNYKGWKAFLIFALTDEAFSLHCANQYDDGDPRHKMYTQVISAALIWFYWVAASLIGALIGSVIPFSTEGIDFALTALFIVILMEQIKGNDRRLPAWMALVSSLACLLVLGPSNFILPSLLITVALMIVFRKQVEGSTP